MAVVACAQGAAPEQDQRATALTAALTDAEERAIVEATLRVLPRPAG